MGPVNNPGLWFFVPVVCKVDGSKINAVAPKAFVDNFEHAVEYVSLQLNEAWEIDHESLNK